MTDQNNSSNDFSFSSIFNKSLNAFIAALVKFPAISVEVFLHRNFGERYLNPVHVFGVGFLLYWILPFFTELTMGLHLFFVAFFVLSTRHIIKIHKRFKAADYWHTKSSGVPYNYLWRVVLSAWGIGFYFLFVGATYLVSKLSKYIATKWELSGVMHQNIFYGLVVFVLALFVFGFYLDYKRRQKKGDVQPINEARVILYFEPLLCVVIGVIMGVVQALGQMPEYIKSYSQYKSEWDIWDMSHWGVLANYLIVAGACLFVRGQIQRYISRQEFLDKIDAQIESQQLENVLVDQKQPSQTRGFSIAGTKPSERVERQKFADMYKNLNPELKNLVQGKETEKEHQTFIVEGGSKTHTPNKEQEQELE